MAPPGFPATWMASPQTNMTGVGFDAGTVVTDFFGSCVSPETQRMKTVYPDQYTVLTLCAERLQFIVSPDSRNGSCAVWGMANEQHAELCTLCSCPFCVRDTNGFWTTKPNGMSSGEGIEWSSNSSETSPITGEPIQLWKGSQNLDGDTFDVTYAASELTGLPHTLAVNSPLWISAATYFASLTTTVPTDAFDVPAICPHASVQSKASRPKLPPPPLPSQPPPPPQQQQQQRDEWTPATVPPTFGDAFTSFLIVNISQPGYDGGNVFLNFTADCSGGAFAQKSKVTFGNFHTVLLRCDRQTIYRYDLAGIDCSTSAIPSDISSRVCQACTLPFGIRDTAGVWTTDGELDGFSFGPAHVDPQGELLYSGVEKAPQGAARQLALEAAFAPGGRPRVVSVTQPNWIRTRVNVVEYEPTANESAFEPPPCFHQTA